MQAAGFDADPVGDAAEGLGALAARRYDVIVADHQLPVATGIDLLAALRGTVPRTPVIVCSGMLNADDIAEARSLGAFAILEKPLEIHVLIETVRAAAQRSR